MRESAEGGPDEHPASKGKGQHSKGDDPRQHVRLTRHSPAGLTQKARALAIRPGQQSEWPDLNRRPLDPQDGGSGVIAAQSVFAVRAWCSPTCGLFILR